MSVGHEQLACNAEKNIEGFRVPISADHRNRDGRRAAQSAEPLAILANGGPSRPRHRGDAGGGGGSAVTSTQGRDFTYRCLLPESASFTADSSLRRVKGE